MSAIRIARERVDSPSAIEPLWRDLESRADATFFQSWTWIGSWLATTRRRAGLEILLAWRDERLVGAGVLARGESRRHRLIPLRTLYLNSSGDPLEDVVAIEFNGFLVEREDATLIEGAMVAAILDDPTWDQLILSGVPASFEALVDGRGLQVHIINRETSPYVDLRAFGADSARFIDSRSRNTRDQIRRSHRLYGARGPLRVTRARDAAEAIDFLRALKPLHQAHWNARQKPGAFAAPYFEWFHEALIRTGFPRGEIALLRIDAGERTIGYLYNFAYRGRMMSYQSGFEYEDDNRLKPGMVCHTLAIEHAMAEGFDLYDFLAGDARYKASLATESNTLLWIAAQRPRLVFRVEGALRRLKRAWLKPRDA